MAARAGNTLVDESRWAGGLEPTALGRVYNPTGGSSYNSPELEGYRRKLSRMKRVVDKWVEKEFERHVEEGKVALKMKEKLREKRGRDGVYDGDADNDGDAEDWTGLSTNEHEKLAQQRAEEMNVANKLLISEKWSLDRALLLHGESHEIPSRYTSYNAMRGERPKDVQNERDKLNKRLDIKQKKASADLYCAYKIIQQALNRLDIGENMIFSSDVMTAVCQYVNLKDGFKVNGVAPKNTVIKAKDRNGKKIDDRIIIQQEQQNEYNKQRQMAALSSAIIYLECKKSRLARSVVEICSSFELPANFTMDKLTMEPFIKQKHLSRAVNSIKALLPDYIKSVASRAANAGANGNEKASSSSSSSSSLSNGNNQQTIDQINRLTNKLKISPTASKAITKLVLYCQERNICDCSGSRNIRFAIASIIYLVCDAGTTMQQLSKAALKKNEKSRINERSAKNQRINIKVEGDSMTKVKNEACTTTALAIATTATTTTTARKDKNETVKIKMEDSSISKVKKEADITPPTTCTSSSTDHSLSTDLAPRKRKHIRPGGSSSKNRKRQRVEIKKDPFPSDTATQNDDFLLKPLDKVTIDCDEKDATILDNFKNKQNSSSSTTSNINTEKKNTQPGTNVPIMQSYYQWSLEKSWFLSMQQIIQSCNCKGESGFFDFYRKQIYPKRKLLLSVLQNTTSYHDMVGTSTCSGSPSGDCLNGGAKMYILLSNIASVAPLMIVAK